METTPTYVSKVYITTQKSFVKSDADSLLLSSFPLPLLLALLSLDKKRKTILLNDSRFGQFYSFQKRGCPAAR